MSTHQQPDLALLQSEPLLETVSQALADRGWWLGAEAVESSLVRDLRSDLEQLRASDELERAGIGRDLDFQVAERVRGDRIHWLSRASQVQARLLAQMENLRLTLNENLFLGLFEFEAHYAHYPPGSFYRRHLDSFRGAANRVVSAVIYLNENWQTGDGGELVLYAESGDEVLATIVPRAGSMLLFLSEELPHEVLPAKRDRYSIAGWYRLNASIGNQIDPAR